MAIADFPNCSVMNYPGHLPLLCQLLEVQDNVFVSFLSSISSNKMEVQYMWRESGTDKHIGYCYLWVFFLGQLICTHLVIRFPWQMIFLCVYSIMKPNMKMLPLQTFFWVKIVSVPKGKIIAALTVYICFSLPLAVFSCCVQMEGFVEEIRNLFIDKYHISHNISQQHI